MSRPITTLAQRVRLSRKRMELTQAQLAAMSGLKQSDISKIELGIIEKTTGIARLAQALGVRSEWLEPGHDPEVDQPVNHQPIKVSARALSWGDVKHMADDDLGELFETEMPDGSGGDKHPRGMKIIWSTTKAPTFGSLVLLRDRHRELHAREYRQGTSPGQWVGAALRDAYRSFHSDHDDCVVVAVAKYGELP